LADLPVKLIGLGLDLISGFVPLVEQFGGAIDQVALPGRDHRRVDVESAGQLGCGLFVC
jgi:hypothetical protein